MGLVLVDSNVLLDVLTRDTTWYDWSAQQLARVAEGGQVAINPLIYAELSMGFERIEELDAALPETLIRRLPLPWEAGFLAGRAFLSYRRNRGTRRSPMPDFYIGAHASLAGIPLLTRDASRYRTYFPKLEVISP